MRITLGQKGQKLCHLVGVCHELQSLFDIAETLQKCFVPKNANMLNFHNSNYASNYCTLTRLVRSIKNKIEATSILKLVKLKQL